MLFLLCDTSIIVSAQQFSFYDIKYQELESKATDLMSRFAMVAPAKESLQVPPAKHGSIECSPSIIRVSDMATLKSDSTRPQMLISGEIHGDERVVGLGFIQRLA